MSVLNENVVLDKYENKFLQRMNEMRNNNDLCDVSFIVKGQKFPCHKIMLVNATLDSSYFNILFNSTLSESANSFQNVTLEDIEPEAFEEILNAIYTTQFHLHSGNAYFILRASHMLQLTDVFDVVLARLLNNPCIDYLIETCLFAEIVGKKDLQSECITEIAMNLDYLCMTDSFDEMITVEIFRSILKNPCLIVDKQALFQIIMHWCTHHKSSQDEVLLLLNSANLKSGCMNAQTMAKLIVNSYDSVNDKIAHAASSTSQYENTKTESAFSDIQSPASPSADICFSYIVQLNTIEVKSGAKGWATVQFKNDFKEYDIIYYEQSIASYRKMKQVDAKLYCFEYDKKSEKNVFSYVEDKEKCYLTVPSTSPITRFDIEAVNDTIYLLTNKKQLWKYDGLGNVWVDVSAKLYFDLNGYGRSRPPKDSVYSNFIPKLISCNNQLYVVEESEVTKVIPHYQKSTRMSRHNQERIVRIYSNSAVCSYDNKLVMCGSNHGHSLHSDVIVYDTVANNWYRLTNMNIERANHTLSYHAGFLFAIENRPMVFNENEKYDTTRGEWINIPPLPQRLHFSDRDIILGTGHVLHCTIHNDVKSEALEKRKGMENAVQPKPKRSRFKKTTS